MIIHNFSELLINVAYDLNKNNATLELNLIYDKMNKTDLKNFSFYKSNEKDFETVKKRLINYFKGGI